MDNDMKTVFSRFFELERDVPLDLYLNDGKIQTYNTDFKDVFSNYVKSQARFLSTAEEFPEFTMLSGKYTLSKGKEVRRWVNNEKQRSSAIGGYIKKGLAKQLYGDDPDAIKKLVENDQTEIAIPLALGAVATGLDVKDSVNLATTAALAASTYANGAGTITANANGALTVDSVAVAVDDRILVKNQASALQNGIYKVTATGSAGAVFVLTRTPDADAASEITGGAFTFVEKGTINADNGYVFTHDGTPTLGSTAITVAQFSGAGQITAGAALLKTNNTLDVRVDDSSIQVTSDALNVKALGVTNAMLAGSIANAKLANSVITVTDGTNSTATALGGTVTFTESEAIDITESSGTVTIAAEVATSANKGVASFNTGNFTVASGDVTVTTIDGGSY